MPRRENKDVDASTKSPSPPTLQAALSQPGLGCSDLHAQPATGGWWTGIEGSSGPSHHYPHGIPSANPWGFPPRGFVNLLNQGQFSPSQPPPLGENFHLVGLTQPLNPISPPPPPRASGSSVKRASSKQRNPNINIDKDDVVDASKSVKKRHWSHEEEVRPASAWLNNSNDSINGNDKKSDTFWGQITDEFNKNVGPDRRRDSNQLKIHWSRLKTVINDFNGCWSKVTKLNRSGMSDDQLMDEAQQLFIKDHGKPFALVHWWRTLKNEPKWSAQVAQLQKDKDKNTPINVDDDKSGERPIGREAAKAQRNGKRKAEQVMDGISLLGENVNKIVAMQQERKQEREKVTNTQLEISKLQLKAAKEQKDAKLLEVYNSLLKQDISQMTNESKARRDKALAKMELRLFGDDADE